MFNKGNNAIIKIFSKNVVGAEWQADLVDTTVANSVFVKILRNTNQLTDEECLTLKKTLNQPTSVMLIGSDGHIIFNGVIRLAGVNIGDTIINLIFNQ